MQLSVRYALLPIHIVALANLRLIKTTMPDKTMHNRYRGMLGVSLGIMLSWLGGLPPGASAQIRLPEGPAASRSTLTTGSRSAEVAELQAVLRLLGYYTGAVDSVYGETTIAAVTRFQQVAGLTADGIVGKATWDRLLPAVSNAPAPRPVDAPTPQPTASPNPAASNPTAESATVSLPTLKLGMKGAAVMGLQDRLRALGLFDGAIDGVFGPATQTAVKAAQQKFQLDPDGVVGPTTWSILLRAK